MNDEIRQKPTTEKRKKRVVRSAKECAYLAVFVALVIAAQLALSAIPSVEIVTVLFVSYAFVMGAQRGMIAATAFSLLRQLTFGFFPTVLILYLVYYNLLTVCFGLLGKKIQIKLKTKTLSWLVLIASTCTVCFTMIDCVITPLWYGYSASGAKAYFFASLPFMLPQVVCTAVTVSCLFLPLTKAFTLVKSRIIL